MTTKCIELEHPHDGQRKATIVTDDENVCRILSVCPDAQLEVVITSIFGYGDEVNDRMKQGAAIAISVMIALALCIAILLVLAKYLFW